MSFFRTPTQGLSPDATPTHSRLNTPCFSPPPLHSDSNCSTPTQVSPPQCYSPVQFSHATTGSTTCYQAAMAHNGHQPMNGPPAYINPPPYRQSSTLPLNAFNGTGVLRSSLRQSGNSLPRQSSTGSVPPYLSELQTRGSPQPIRKVNFCEPPVSPKKTKKISFVLPSDIPPALPKKPAPPKRADSTRLTSPKKLANSTSAPPTDFLKDLQRVMRKKWQVAQKCKLEPSTTPHEVLGFRDPPPPAADYRETNVSNWVQEHYGYNNLYENIYRQGNNETVVEYATSPVHIQQQRPVSGKRPPPPPPKRSETTHLSTKTH